MTSAAVRNFLDTQEIARRRSTWNWSLRPFASVIVDMTAKEDIQELVLEMLTKSREGLTKTEVDEFFSKKRTPEAWNLVSLVLQTLFEDHPSAPDMLRKIQDMGCLEWKPDPR